MVLPRLAGESATVTPHVPTCGYLESVRNGERVLADLVVLVHVGFVVFVAAGGPLVRIDPELGWTLRENVSAVTSVEPWQEDLLELVALA